MSWLNGLAEERFMPFLRSSKVVVQIYPENLTIVEVAELSGAIRIRALGQHDTTPGFGLLKIIASARHFAGRYLAVRQDNSLGNSDAATQEKVAVKISFF
jgi:hypothetical protein